uniref:Uncharacterized protein n=1 Tax=Ananas comosus var. bracteatus TaxID=296719 RepID=A0A6V7NXC4_ANACO|nr:unnamed protein product [Ananas comosus var. bracteatus]
MAFNGHFKHLLKRHASSPSPPPPSPHGEATPHLHPTCFVTFSRIFQLCAEARAHRLGRAAHARMLTSRFAPTTFVSNCLLHMYARCADLDHARKVFDRIPHRDPVSYNAMIAAYVHDRSMPRARLLFDEMPQRDVISWNSVISGYCENGDFVESIGLFSRMGHCRIDPDRTTFAIALKVCAGMEDLDVGAQLHGLVAKLGFDVDVVVGSALVDAYAKCRCLRYSLQLFDEMPDRNWVSWSAVIAGCVRNERYIDGLELFVEMQRLGFGVSQSAYASVFRSCAGLCSLSLGSQFHTHALKNNFSSDTVVGTAIVDMYAKCNSINDAMSAFLLLPNPTLQSWNAIIVGSARNDRGFESMELFRLMNRSGVGFDEISISGVFSACAEVKGYLQGLQIHCLAIKTSFESDVCVKNAILDMYGKCKALREAFVAFDEMGRRDAVSWNAFITALEQNEQYDDTLLHFKEMLQYNMEPDEFTYGSVVKACAGLGSLDYGMMVHDKIIKSGLWFDSFVGSALVDMYCKCGMMEEAQKLHLRIGNRSLVSWNALISGFSFHKESEEAQKCFSEMLDLGLKPDNFTYATILDTCANLATAGLGKQIHAQIIKQEMQRDVYISSTLVDMYAKCGNMHDSLLMFEKMHERDYVTWNAMICGFAMHGHGEEAIGMFERMELANVRPNHATFIAVLRACGHVGLVDEGMRYFRLMTHRYKLEPQLEHFACMVDIAGRSKGPYNALNLINEMPFEADAVIWRTLLTVCKIHQNVEVAELAANKLLLIEPDDSAAYILLSNIYAESGKWAEVSKMRRILRQAKLKKEPGCSWIEVKSEMHAFLVGDKAHPKCSEIYEMLDELIGEMTWAGYEPLSDSLIDDKKEEGGDQQEFLGVCSS